jgi:type I restriction enzyme S subunit
VSEKERWLELLAEKRRALITNAVTRGLNSDALVRDCGIPWLGPIPQHWQIERTKWLFKERDERTENDEGEMLTVSHITGVTPRAEKEVNMFEAETTEGYKICRKGDLAINTLWAWMGAMGVSPCDGIVSPAYNVYTPGPKIIGGYVDALVRMPHFAQEVIRYSKGVWSSRLRLYPEGFFEIWFPVPPLEEQRAIIAHISEATAKVDALSAATERTIDLLKERRTALIAAAVTGKLNYA